MSWELLIGLLTNGSVAAVVGFITSWRLNRAKEKQDYDKIKEAEHETADDKNKAQYEEIMALRERMADMERALIRIRACKHYDACPVAVELQEHKGAYRYFYTGIRQHRLEKKGERRPRDSTEGTGRAGDSDSEPP